MKEKREKEILEKKKKKKQNKTKQNQKKKKGYRFFFFEKVNILRKRKGAQPLKKKGTGLLILKSNEIMVMKIHTPLYKHSALNDYLSHRK
jgi:hypothetical protein